jgi:hypothetical protein
MGKKYLILIVLTAAWLTGFPQLKYPADYFGHESGSRFTHHHEVAGYFRMLDGSSDLLTLIPYGTTIENRPLFIVIISSDKNLRDIEKIRNKNLSLAGLEPDNSPGIQNKVIVWLSFNVHGDEASSTEAAMETAWQLIGSPEEGQNNWLENTIVIIDPCLNPDGRERYISWYEQIAGDDYNPDPITEEHHQSWPGGRGNHYHFDLNRDWSWVTQQETEYRIRMYNDWLPQVHVDFHEQGINNPYYFAPAAPPYHQLITPWQRSFQVVIGKNNAKYFDARNWLYFTKERYDLFYPGYGDTYPMFNGSIGMTYEQAGGGAAGLGIILENEDTLTLRDRIEHHTTAALAIIETASENAASLLENFRSYFDIKNPSLQTPYTAFIVASKNPISKIEKIIRLLKIHKISYGYLDENKVVDVFDYESNSLVRETLEKGDIVIPVAQPKSKLVQALFEPVSILEDSLTYDITAWSVPYAFGLKAYAARQLPAFKPGTGTKAGNDAVIPNNFYALAFRHDGLFSMQMMLALMQKDLKLRVIDTPAIFEGTEFGRGSFFITMADNRRPAAEIKKIVNETREKIPVIVYPLVTGMSAGGNDIGSPHFKLAEKLKIGILSGQPVSPEAFGEIWYFFDRELNYPLIKISSGYFKTVNLGNIDVFIVPDGDYAGFFDEENLKKIKEWVDKGGKLILMEGALSVFAGREEFALKMAGDNDGNENGEIAEKKPEETGKYGDQERMNLKDIISGGIFRVEIDNTHPIGYGYDRGYYSLKMSGAHYTLTEKGWKIGVINDASKKISGFAGSNTSIGLMNSLVFGEEQSGIGSIIYMVDNPLFRNFWENGKMLFANAVFLR